MEFLERMADAGNSPAALENRPLVPDWSQIYLATFLNLSSQRSMGMNGPDPILFSEIEVYLRLLDLRDLPLVVDIIVSIDRRYLKAIGDKSNGRQNVKAKASGGRGISSSVGRKA